MKKRKKIIKVVLIAILITFLGTTFVSFSVTLFLNNKAKKNAITEQVATNTAVNSDSKVQAPTASTNTDLNTQKTEDVKTGSVIDLAKMEKESSVSFKKEQATKYDAGFSTELKKSPLGKNFVCITGKGNDSQEEGIGKIIVKSSDNKISSYTLNGLPNQSPKSVSWVNDKYVAVLVGYAYGTDSKSSRSFLMDIETGDVYSVYKVTSEKEKISAISKKDDKLVLTVRTYKDDKMVDFVDSQKEFIIK